MSAETSGDVSRINDEDVLRKMWQDTEDFGRKKEIRAHMYKLREARLREFYNSGEVNTDFQGTTTRTTHETKSSSTPTHADSLADHSFISMKTKEIRDSESPTRDVSYRRVHDKSLANQGWNVVTSNKASDDGKTFTTTKIATTSGSEKIDGGKLDYAAKNEQQASVYRDGDDKNFTKAVGASSNTVIKQEAAGGDENSSFRSSSTKTTSSSKMVTEHHSTSGDVDIQAVPTKAIQHDDSTLVSRKTYTENIPSDLKNHPSYVDGKTKVTRETRTLPDGTTVTTTRYEIKGGTSSQSVKSNQFSTQQHSSTSQTNRNQSESRTTRYIEEQQPATTTRTITHYVNEEPTTTTRTVTKSSNDHRTGTVQDSNIRTVTKTSSDQHTGTVQGTNTSTTTLIKNINDYRNEPQSFDDSTITVRKISNQQPRIDDSSTTTTRTTVVKNIHESTNQRPIDTSSTTTTKTTVIKNIQDTRELQPIEITITRDDRKSIADHTSKVNRHEENERFIAVEKQDTRDREPKRIEPSPERRPRPQQEPKAQEPHKSPERRPKPEQEPYQTPERRQPIKPGKSEFDDKPQPTDGQYETTYRTDFTNKRISVDVSPTHEAFARSLRACSPDRIHKSSSPSRSSLRNSNTSLRSSTSPEKMRHPSRVSPERRSISPKKNTDRFSSSETITYKNRSDTLTKKTNTAEIDSSTLTRRKTKTPRSRSPSPTSIASDIEYIRNTDIVTDLDTNETTVVTNGRPSTLEITKKVTRKITDRSPTSPLTDLSSPKKSPGNKDTPRRSSLRNVSPTKEPLSPRSDRPLKRTDTYEERCRQILGITNATEQRRGSIEKITRRTTVQKTTDKKSPTKEMSLPTTKSPGKKVQEFPSQIRKSPEKESLTRYPEKKSPVKDSPKISEFPSQIRKSPEKKEPGKINEFPSQIRRSPEKEPLGEYPQKRRPTNEGTTICEFPSQIRRSPNRESPRSTPERELYRYSSPEKESATINEFPSQIRRSPEKEPLEKYPEKTKPSKDGPSLNEFPSQIRRTPEREPLEKYPERSRPRTEAPSINEFPSQIRRSPEKEPLEQYPEKVRQTKDAPSINEFPSQVRRSPEKEPLERYPEKVKPEKEAPSICEFPSQIRKSPEKEPLEKYPEKSKPQRESPSINEFPSQVRKSPQKEPLEKYPEKVQPTKDAPKIDEFPSQIRRSPQREPLEKYPEKSKPQKESPKINEFPSQLRKSPEREPLGEYPEKSGPTKDAPKIAEFPSQIRKSPQKEPLEKYPEKSKPQKDTPKINEFPSQVRKSPEKEPLERYPEKTRPTKDAPKIDEFPSQIRKSPQKEPLDKYPEKTKPQKEAPKINEFPSQVKRTPVKEPLEKYPEKSRPDKSSPKIAEFPSQIRKSPEKEPLQKYPEKSKPQKETPKIAEFPSQVRKSPVKEPLEKYPEKTRPGKDSPKIDEFPSQTRKSPEKPKYISQIHPTAPSKKDKPRHRTTSESSSSTDEEKDVEEITTVTRVTELEGRAPIDEPVVTKKFISQLCRDDEIQRTDVTKKTTKNVLEQQIIETSPKKPNKTVKKDTPRKPNGSFIENERHHTEITVNKYSSPSIKKPLTEKNTITTTTKKTTGVINTRTDTKTTRKISDEKPKPRDVKKTSEKITLYDIENLNKTETDNRVHIRTHRIDDTVNKRVTKPVAYGDVTRRTPSKPIKPEEQPKSRTQQKITTKIETETKRTVTEQKTPKRHVVTTTINVSPRTRPSPAKTPTRTVKVTSTTTTARTSNKLTKKPTLQNGHVTTDDESVADSLEDLTEETTVKHKGKISRTTSDQVIKKKPETKTPVRGSSKPELLPSKSKPEKKVITTKSIIINNEGTEREVIVDLQRSKSSREPSPNRVCPLPVSSDDESSPRYPDQIVEPDDGSLRRKPKKLSDIPILESEDTAEEDRITEITETRKKVDRVEETDESLLSVNKKISKFLDTADKVTKIPQGPAPKVQRPQLEVDEDLESDECLLSVSQKVNKFINTAEQLTTQPDRPKSPKCQYYPDEDVSVSDKVAHFITTAEKVVQPQKGPAPKVARPDFKDIDDNIREDECLLSVTDKVTKFVNTTDSVTNSKKSVSLSKIDVKPARKSPERETTPTRRPSNQYSSIKTEETKYTRRESSPKLPDSTPKSTRRPSEEEPKSVLSPTGHLRSTESVKKAKALFENITKDQQILKQRDILSRPSVFEGRNTTVRKLHYDDEEEQKTLKSTRLVMDKTRPRSKTPEKHQEPYMKSLDKVSETFTRRSPDFTRRSPERASETSPRRSPDKIPDTFSRRSPDNFTRRSPDKTPDTFTRRSPDKTPDTFTRRSPDKETFTRRSQSPDDGLPGYMRPLDRSLRPNSPHRDNINQLHKKSSIVKDEDYYEEEKHTKFGVTLRRTESGRTPTTTTTTTTTASKKIGINFHEITETDIEEIYDLELLEELLLKVVGYDLRRKIRAQIRIVKQLISENKLVEVIQKKTVREKSPVKLTKVVKDSSTQQRTTEYQSSYSYSERRSSSEYTNVTRRSQSPEKSTLVEIRGKSPEGKPSRAKSPEKKVFQTQLKKTTPTTKPTVVDSTPEWVRQRNLKKPSDNKTITKTSTTSTTSSLTKKTRSSPLKETKPTDIITSSYGVGPTDENGTPLFGLKALRAQNKTETSKVQGTVIRSQYYSENGHEPVGEISVTKYSSDPRDLGRNEDVKGKGITSVTTTQKFGYKDTPSLKSLTKKKKEICDKDETTTTTKTTKVNRRGSVKALSQKFIENAVETSKSERQSSYPKAGLILRTSSFKESASSGDSREGSSERTVTVKTSSSRTVAGETFLTNRSRVTGVQDVISRMKSDDVRDGDSTEDVEARGLLNKFLGSQVILSGLESNLKTSSSTTTTSSGKKSTKITSTLTEGGKPTTKTRIFQHPLTEDDLETVWEEQTLRLLLEQSTDYEERRIIRARLRQVMAEQEACTDLVEKASQEQSGTTFEGATTTKKTFTEGPITTTQAVTSRVTTQQTVKKPISPFAKFRQLDKQNSLNTPPSTPKTPSGSGPLFKFTDPALSQSASTVKDRLLHWCRMKTKEYENIQLDNFSSSWADGLAFCALIHHFLPEAFDYHALSPKNRRHNFTLAFQVADEKADIAPLLDVDDMVACRKPDWKCVFTYVQSIYRRFKDED